MQVWIDNHDGLGSVNYTACLQMGKDSRIVRQLNKSTLCTLLLLLGNSGLSVPGREASVQVVGLEGSFLFYGTCIAAPVSQAIGAGAEGPAFSVLLSAVSNEVLLDASVAAAQTALLGENAQQSWSTLMKLSSDSAIPLALSAQLTGGSRVEVSAGSTWSRIAGELGDTTRSVYSVTSSGVQVASLGQVVHAVAAADNGLSLEGVHVNDLRWLASDVTVCGREEPTAYVTEVFTGDGSTTAFTFSEKHFSPVAKQKTTILDLFQGTSLNPSLWSVNDPSGLTALTAAGLTCNGGTGRDAEVTVSSVQQIELGGVLTIEGDGVQVSSGSAGILLGLYAGAVTTANCFAGFAVSSSGSLVTVNAQVNGATAGSSFTPQQGHLYTFRLRLFVPEVERVRQSYCYPGESGTAMCGGNSVPSSGILEFAVQDVTSGTPGLPTILYVGSVSSVPPACYLGLLDSGSLVSDIRSVSCTQSAPLWVAMAQTGAGPQAQFLASALNGGSCEVTTTGNLEFYPGNVPPAGSLIYANYRLGARAVARRALAATSGDPITPAETWIGSVSAPVPWSSVDCDSAAEALLGIASSSSAAIRGTYKVTLLPRERDIWPGDALEIGPFPDESVLNAIVREVEIKFMPGAPTWAVRFANDWAESISIKLSSAVPENTVIPQQPLNIAGALQSLAGLSVTDVTGTTLSLNAGLSPPVNGGFEIRRRDNTFGPGIDSDLVLRAATPNIDVPRTTAVERYYVRIYDGASPPNYSLFSAAIFLNVPL